MFQWLRKVERGLFHLLGPAQVDSSADEPDPAPSERGTMIEGGFERRGTPGNYYIVKADPPDDPPE